jgi:hypothetical protein
MVYRLQAHHEPFVRGCVIVCSAPPARVPLHAHPNTRTNARIPVSHRKQARESSGCVASPSIEETVTCCQAAKNRRPASRREGQRSRRCGSSPLLEGRAAQDRLVSLFRDYTTLCSSYPRDELYERWQAHSYGLGKYDVKALLLRDQENQEITRCRERCSMKSTAHQGMLTQRQHVPIAIFHPR